MNLKKVYFVWSLFLFILMLNGCAGVSSVHDPLAVQNPVFNDERLRLTAEYSAIHYGINSSSMSDPQIVVVHYTAIPTLEKTMEFFQPTLLNKRIRGDIASGGDVNVSAHYVVDKNGALYQLAADDILCRHIIGFNYTAIGIENVAADVKELTDAQAEATAALIKRLKKRHPSIKYVIGHHEYRDSTKPHYKLLVEKDPDYKFTDKIDPGTVFMDKVRKLLGE